jgi:chemotaxis protein MotB
MAAKAQSNIIRKIEVIEEHGHHGGAWKVAYADFMTAMMAFFLLLWILSSSDEQKLRGIAEYFTNATLPGGSGVLDGATLGPPGTLNASNGAIVARGAELGKIDDPAPARWEVRDATPTASPAENVKGSQEGIHEYPAGGAASTDYSGEVIADAEKGSGKTEDAEEAEKPSQAAQANRFDALQAELMQAMDENPDLRPLKQNVVFEQTIEGLRIQIVDQKGKPMFPSGRAEMGEPTRKLMQKLGESLATLPNKMVISGHTDAVPFTSRRSYDNWDLSADRANATRRFLEANGVDANRVLRVSGMADTELLVENDPLHPSNRRISILLQFDNQRMNQTADTENLPASDTSGPEQAGNISSAAHKAPKPAADQKMETKEIANVDTLLTEEIFNNLRSALR